MYNLELKDKNYNMKDVELVLRVLLHEKHASYESAG